MDITINYIVLITAVLILLVFVYGCSISNNPKAVSNQSNYIKLDASGAYDLVKKNTGNDDFVILDVRTPEEYENGHISGAVNVNYNTGDFREKLAAMDKSKTYLVHCKTGSRSLGAVKIMSELEFENIYHMVDGILGWTNAGYPTE